jgi:hypothetical protein
MIDGLDGLNVEKQVHQDFYNGETLFLQYSNTERFICQKNSFPLSGFVDDFDDTDLE